MVQIYARLKNFFSKYPAETPASVPLAIDTEGSAWKLNLPDGHAMLFGRPGSGKSSVVHGLIRQLAPFVEEGKLRLYGIDPKECELRPYLQSTLFEDIALDQTVDAISVIDEVHAELTSVLDARTVAFESAEDRSTPAPTAVLIIEEFTSLLLSLQKMAQAGREAAAKSEDDGEEVTALIQTAIALGKLAEDALGQLTKILSTGRSVGVYVFAATQAVEMELLGRMRDNFRHAVFGQGSKYANDSLLGVGAADRGFDSTAIPVATKANDYLTAGIAYVSDETGGPKRVHFAHTSDEEVAELVRKFPRVEFLDPHRN